MKIPHILGCDMTIEKTFDNFILSRRLADLSPKTIKDYTEFITPFIEFVGANTDIETLTEADINGYIAKLLDRPLSKSSRATYIRHIKIYLRWLEDTMHIDLKAEQIRVPKNPKRIVKIYSDEEIVQIFNAVQNSSEWVKLRNRCIIALMYDSGLRQSEVCTLKRKNVSFRSNRLVVYGKGNKERTVPLGELTKQVMTAYMEKCPYELKDMIFVNNDGKPLTCNAVKLMVSKVSHKLDFELSSHKLRHNFATNYCLDQYERYGHIDIYRLMIILGHEDVETTRIYLHLANEIIASRESISHLDKLKLIV